MTGQKETGRENLAERNTRKTGCEKESETAAYLAKKGFVILERNFSCRQGEIDIIGMDGPYLVFLEVKYRSSREFDNPLAAVDRKKQQKICRAADYYRYKMQIPSDTPVRYDVVGILGKETVWIRNAFPHMHKR